jgi:LPS sulfotransferase NodH
MKGTMRETGGFLNTVNLFSRVRQIAADKVLLKKKIHTSYLICATPRCGSTMLCEALKNTSVAGYPDEYFYHYQKLNLSQRWALLFYSDYFERILHKGTTPNGVFGVKMMWDNVGIFISEARKISRYSLFGGSVKELFNAVFPNLHYIRLIRRDKIRQAVSWYKAMQSSVWLMDKAGTPQKPLTFNFELINNLYYRLIASEAAWDKYFAECGVTPFHVVYEDFTDHYRETVVAILKYLKIPVPDDIGIGKRRMVKMSDAQSEEWVKRYREIKEGQSSNEKD